MLNDALAAGGVGVLDADLDDGRLRLNPVAGRLLGLTPAPSLRLADAVARVAPGDRRRLLSAWQAAVAVGAADLAVELRARGADGRERWLLLRVRRRGPRATGTLVDATDTVRARRVAREAAAHAQRLIEHDPQVRWFGEPDGRILHFTDRWLELIGMDRAQALAVGWQRLLHPDDADRVRRAWAASVASGAPFDVEHRLRGADGSHRWVRSRARAHRAPDGRIRTWYGATEDIDLRRRTHDALRSAEARLRAVLDQLPIGVGIVEADGRGGVINPRLRALLGDTGYDLPIARYSAHWVGRRPDGHRYASHEWPIARALLTGETVLNEPIRFELDGGTTRDTEVCAAPIRDADDTIVAGVFTVVDVTETRANRRAADVARRTLIESLQAADRRKDVFLATLAHELRNPLAPLRTAARVLADPRLDATRAEWAREVIQRQVRHMGRLLDDLLDLSRISQGKLALVRAPVALARVVDTAIEVSCAAIESRGHRLRLALPPRCVMLDADALRLSQVLANLLTNAAKYTEPGGRLELTARVDGGSLRLSVRDDGIGIPPEALGRVFDTFVQLEGSGGRDAGGLGIGLALVKALVELHGGTVRAASDGHGRGAEFVVTLPLTGVPCDGPCDDGHDLPAARRCAAVDFT